MTTMTPNINSKNISRYLKLAATFITWTVLLSVAVYYFQRDALKYLSYTEQNYGLHNWSHRLWLIPHIIGATLALFLGPTQFWTGVRSKYFKLHRWLGSLYLIGILLGGIGALRMAMVSECRPCSVPLFVLATLWIFTSTMAYITARRRQIKSHKEFMIRSYVLTFAFVLIRLPINTWPIFPEFASPIEGRAVQEWICWVVPLLVTEYWLVWRKSLYQSKRVRA